MLLERFGETVTYESPDGYTVEVENAICHEADSSDQSVMDVQTRFINQARYKGDSRTLTVLWPKDAPHELMDAHLWVRGERYRVYADPFPVAHSPNGYDTRITCIQSLFLYEVELLRAERERDQWGVWRSEYVPTATKANLLRLSDDMQSGARQSSMAGVVLLELPPDTWDDGYVAFRYPSGEDGDRYTVTSVDFAGDVVVIGGQREATDG